MTFPFRPRIAALVALAGVTFAAGCAEPDLTVLGAASTRVINDDLAALSGEPLTFANAGSSSLVQQLVEGAPADVLITADRKNMDDAVSSDLVVNPRAVATNIMVLVVPRDNPADIDSIADIQRTGVNLVLCDSNVPCGASAQLLLEANQLAAQPVSLEHNVADALGKVVSGEADAAFVYRTDALAAGDAVLTLEIPHAKEHPNTLYAAVVKASARPDSATAVVELLTSTEMASVWEIHGFASVQDD